MNATEKWIETAPVGVIFSFFFPLLIWLLKRGCGGWGWREIIIQDRTCPPGLVSFSSLSSLTHSRQLIIQLLPQIPQCTCNYRAHACLPPASCLEGGCLFFFSLSICSTLFFLMLFPQLVCLFLFLLFYFYVFPFPKILIFNKISNINLLL